MPCKSCAARRRLLAAGYAKGGIKGAVKAMPAVGRHLVSNPPALKRNQSEQSNSNDRESR